MLITLSLEISLEISLYGDKILYFMIMTVAQCPLLYRGGDSIYRLASQTVGYTPARLAGLVRQAQSAALTRAQNSGSIQQTIIRWSDFDSPESQHTGGKLTEQLCEPYDSVYNVVNGTAPRTALIHVDSYKNITECLQYLMEKKDFYVQVCGSVCSTNVIL